MTDTARIMELRVERSGHCRRCSGRVRASVTFVASVKARNPETVRRELADAARNWWPDLDHKEECPS